MRFKSQQHKSTFKKAIRKKDKTDNKLMAAMYLLTADLPLWNRVKGSIRENSIDFDEIRLNTVTENGYTLYSASKDMYFNTDHVSLSDIFDTKLIPEKMFNVIITAINIHQHNEGYYSNEAIANCIAEHYGIDDINAYKSRSHPHKNKICRIVRALSDLNDGTMPKDRYIVKANVLITAEFNDVLKAFHENHIKYGYSVNTADNYQRMALRFLMFCEDSNIRTFSDITQKMINEYILMLDGFKKSTVKNHLGGLRIFLRYLYTEKYIPTNLGDDIVPLKVKSQMRIPSVWQHNEVLKLLSVIDRGNPSGKRDYAMILMVARLGIRVGDLCRLQFQDIDWRNNKIEFTQGKTQYRMALPLLKDVGWALIDYIQNGRPKVDTPYIFVTHVAPFKPFDGDNHHSRMIKKYMMLAHLPVSAFQKYGMHSLRHTLATTMLENHEKFSNISAVLGHRSEDSATAYIKTSTALLRNCSLPIPEVCDE